MTETKMNRLSRSIVYLPADHTTDRPILAAITGKEKTLMVDAGSSPAHTELFLRELERQNVRPPEYTVITHWHWDHTFGLSALGIPAVSHRETFAQLSKIQSYEWTEKAIDQRVLEGIEIPFCAEMIKKEYKDPGQISIALPGIIFDKILSICLGGVNCLVEHVGGDHSNDSTLIFVEEEKTLFLGDCLCPAVYAEKWYYKRESVIRLIEKIETYGAQTFVQSHGVPESHDSLSEELITLKAMAHAMETYSGDYNNLVSHLSIELGRDLGQDDLETLGYFLNGLQGC